MGHSVPKPSGPATVFASGKPVKGKVLQLRPELDSQKTLVENELATVATVDPVLVSAKKVAELEASDDTIQPIPNGKAVAGRIHPDQASRKLVAGAWRLPHANSYPSLWPHRLVALLYTRRVKSNLNAYLSALSLLILANSLRIDLDLPFDPTDRPRIFFLTS
jgi:hypothetical protein